jgi:hypothetical protein
MQPESTLSEKLNFSFATFLFCNAATSTPKIKLPKLHKYHVFNIYKGKPSKRGSCEAKIYEMLDVFLFFLGAGSGGGLLSWMARNFSSINSFCN